MSSKDLEINLSQESTIDAGGEKASVAAKDVDEAFRFLSDVDVDHAVQVDDKKLMRRVDWMLMPLMFACYYLQYTDKTLSWSTREHTVLGHANVRLVSYAGIMGIIEDTHMPGNGFSNLAIAFYVSFLVCEPIQSFMLQRYPTAKWLGGNGDLTLTQPREPT